MTKVFVYGTLLSGEGNNILLQNPESRLLGNGKASGFRMFDLGSFPAVIPVEDKTKIITGEIWEITDNVLISLDILEGYPHFYNRVEIQTPFGYAWIYINHDALRYTEIEFGSWKEYKAGKEKEWHK